ncbi:MAG: hypothetical protein CM1200mP10_03600 [Candidatus Neomarinimicrobiota bacterium]|nr:MAG: hypothetical protein CM1200mP10_03600 [Candidatus Neomarinimicrobiota bacterium]
MLDTLSHASLNEVKVVPNPYIVRALWDQNRFTQHIDFRHLPAIVQLGFLMLQVSGLLH